MFKHKVFEDHDLAMYMQQKQFELFTLDGGMPFIPPGGMGMPPGMPPMGGVGMGIDRLLMALTGLGIRETILFPLVKPEE